MVRLFRRVLRHERGATAVEYSLIIALLVLAMMGALMATADTTIVMWNNIAATMPNTG